MGALLVHPAFQRKPDYHAPRPPEMSLEEAGACEVCESQDLAFESAARLLGLVRNLQDSGNILVEYVDANRDEARKAGIESIAIELTAIFEGGRLQKIRESLDEAVLKQKKPSVSLDGLSKIRRVERLVQDAQASLARAIGEPPLESGSIRRPTLGQAKGPTTDVILVMGLLFGAALLTAIVSMMLREKTG